MKIVGAGPTGAAFPARPARGAVPDFAPEASGAAAGPASAGRTAGAGPVAGLDMLLALQEAGGPLERRRRAVRRGERMLDALDALKLVLLAGTPPGDSLARLGEAAAQARVDADDPGLDTLLSQIDVRAAVELAKEQQQAVKTARR